MRRILVALALAALAPGLAACPGAPRPEPQIVTKTVEVPVSTPCPDRRGPAPQYPDTGAAVHAQPNLFERMKLILAGRELRDARLAEDDAQIKACAAPIAKPP